MTRKDLEDIEARNTDWSASDPFGDVFGETKSGGKALTKLIETPPPNSGRGTPKSGGRSPPVEEDSVEEETEPTFEWLESTNFDGTTEGSLDIDYDEAQNPRRSFTIDFWVRAESKGSGYRSPITSRDLPPQRGYAFFITPSGNWSFWMGLPASKEWLKLDGPAVRFGEWQRLTGIYNWQKRFARFLVDGKVAAERSPQGAAFEPNSKRPMRLGGGGTENKEGKFLFAGDLRDLRIYNRVLQESGLPLASVELTGEDLKRSAPTPTAPAPKVRPSINKRLKMS
eukprot:TRINITY_DN16752_c0_g1_i1.p1 TRINITY_DN16752_c0_g1~~TRINITY_DN16752_c0_g1_i1.p1  ORF type:complete len:283 (+),score=63.59 TRINITY_DN16752_c0_g1_i1:2215-3063(+)